MLLPSGFAAWISWSLQGVKCMLGTAKHKTGQWVVAAWLMVDGAVCLNAAARSHRD